MTSPTGEGQGRERTGFEQFHAAMKRMLDAFIDGLTDEELRQELGAELYDEIEEHGIGDTRQALYNRMSDETYAGFAVLMDNAAEEALADATPVTYAIGPGGKVRPVEETPS